MYMSDNIIYGYCHFFLALYYKYAYLLSWEYYLVSMTRVYISAIIGKLDSY
jgi:hypothetical protein